MKTGSFFIICLALFANGLHAQSLGALKTLKSVAQAEKKLTSLSKGAAQDQARFDIALALGALGEPLRGLSYLKGLEKNSTGYVPADLIQMNLGRLYFEMAQLDKALEAYQKVPKSSEFWLEAQEERAHALGRRKDYDKVLSVLATVISPVFDGQIGPEPFFVSSLTSYKICDYASIFKTTELYKTRFKPRLHELSLLANNGGSEHLDAALARLATGDISLTTIGGDGKFLPRNLLRDELIKTGLAKQKEALKTATEAGNIRAQAIKGLIVSRILTLARLELREIQDVTQKLNILEADVIQRIHAVEKGDQPRPVQGDLARSSADVLVFPETGESWADELDKYQAQVKGCPEKTKRKL